MLKKIIVLLLVVVFAVMGAKVANFTSKDVNGKTWSLDSLLGKKLTIISFWSTSCAPCKEELKLLDSLYEIYEDSGLSVVAVNIDTKRTLPQVKPMVTSAGWDFPVLVDPDGVLMKLFKVSPIPHSFYIKPDKELVKSVIGFTKKDAAAIAKTIQNAVHGIYNAS